MSFACVQWKVNHAEIAKHQAGDGVKTPRPPSGLLREFRIVGTLWRRHEFLQFLEPILHNDHAHRIIRIFLDHQEPSVRSHVV